MQPGIILWGKRVLAVLGIASLITGASVLSVVDSAWPNWRNDLTNPAAIAWLLVLLGLIALLVVFLLPAASTERRTSAATNPSGLIAATFATQRDEIVNEIRGRPEFKRVARMLGTELRDIRTKIERVKATNPPTYPPGFQLPGAKFAQHESVLAADPNIYDIVSRAYTAAHHVNENLKAREARRRPGNRTLFGAIPEDGLDQAHGAAGEALDALGERHNEPFRTPVQKAALGLMQDVEQDEAAALLSLKHAQAVESAKRDIMEQGERLAEELVGTLRSGGAGLDLMGRGFQWCSRCLQWADDADLSRERRAAFRDAPAAPTTAQAMLEAVEANLRVLKDIGA